MHSDKTRLKCSLIITCEGTYPFLLKYSPLPREVRNRFKGLDLIDRVPGELWMEVHDIVKETGSKTISKKKKCKKAK